MNVALMQPTKPYRLSQCHLDSLNGCAGDNMIGQVGQWPFSTRPSIRAATPVPYGAFHYLARGYIVLFVLYGRILRT